MRQQAGRRTWVMGGGRSTGTSAAGCAVAASPCDLVGAGLLGDASAACSWEQATLASRRRQRPVAALSSMSCPDTSGTLVTETCPSDRALAEPSEPARILPWT